MRVRRIAIGVVVVAVVVWVLLALSQPLRMGTVNTRRIRTGQVSYKGSTFALDGR